MKSIYGAKITLRKYLLQANRYILVIVKSEFRAFKRELQQAFRLMTISIATP